MRLLGFRTGAFLAASLLPVLTYASFPDVPKDSAGYEAITYLNAKEIVSGYPDGTFRPEAEVNRAELAKLLVTSRGATPSAEVFHDCFPDVQKEWFSAYICYAKAQGWVSGYADGTFKPSATITKPEGIKMIVKSQALDENAYGEIRLALAIDVTDPEAWFYPYMRLALATSMISVDKSGKLGTTDTLNRENTSQLLFRLLIYKEGKRSQALLNEVENEIILTDKKLSADLTQSQYASARALVAARGALSSAPDVALIKSVVKISEAYRALVRALEAGKNSDLDETIRLDGDAWNLAAKAKELSSDGNIADIAGLIQEHAQQMANDARALKQPSPVKP